MIYEYILYIGSCEQTSVRVPYLFNEGTRFKIANYKTINVWDQEYNKDVI